MTTRLNMFVGTTAIMHQEALRPSHSNKYVFYPRCLQAQQQHYQNFGASFYVPQSH